MKRVLLGLVTPFLLLTACKKNESVKVSVPGYVRNAGEFVQKFGPKKQYYSLITTELPKTLRLDQGTMVTVPANAIQKNANYISGNITVEAYEFLKRSDIILGGVNTDHFDGSPVESKGMLFIDIVFNKKSVDTELKNLMNITIPASQGGYIKISAGNTDVNGTGQLAWGPQMIDSINSDGSNYTFNTMMIGWLNCGNYFAHSNPKSTLTVNLQNNPGEMATFKGGRGNTFVYFCPKNSRVAMQLYSLAGAGIVKSYDNAMPVGVEGRLIAFSIKENKFYYASKDITTTIDHLETLSFSEITDAVLVSKIMLLNNY